MIIYKKLDEDSHIFLLFYKPAKQCSLRPICKRLHILLPIEVPAVLWHSSRLPLSKSYQKWYYRRAHKPSQNISCNSDLKKKTGKLNARQKCAYPGCYTDVQLLIHGHFGHMLHGLIEKNYRVQCVSDKIHVQCAWNQRSSIHCLTTTLAFIFKKHMNLFTFFLFKWCFGLIELEHIDISMGVNGGMYVFDAYMSMIWISYYIMYTDAYCHSSATPAWKLCR